MLKQLAPFGFSRKDRPFSAKKQKRVQARIKSDLDGYLSPAPLIENWQVEVVEEEK